MIIHTDCRHYRGSMPCSYHKRDGRLCDGCADYDAIANRILIVKLAAVGDVLRTTSILPPLKAKYPASEITWITKASAAPLLKGNRLVDRLLVVEENYLDFLLGERFDLGICLDADIQSATILSLARCGSTFGFVQNGRGKVVTASDSAVEWWSMGVNDELKRKNRKTYQHIMYEICGLPLPTHKPQLALREDEEEFGRSFLHRHRIDSGAKIIGINTGGGGRWQYKKWTTEGYLGFIRLFKERHPDVELLLFGGPEEVDLNRRILAAAGDMLIDAGCDNSLMEFSSLINVTDILLTSDSLAMHMGVALGKSTVVLVGPTSPWELDVFGKGEIIHSDIDCLVCYLSRCDKTVTCMSTLSPEFVVERVEHHLHTSVHKTPALRKDG